MKDRSDVTMQGSNREEFPFDQVHIREWLSIASQLMLQNDIKAVSAIANAPEFQADACESPFSCPHLVGRQPVT
jgi:hypothetical protein